MSPESWKSFFEIGGVALLALTFIFGYGALHFSHQVNELQEQHLRQFDSDLTSAKTALSQQQERAANADARVAGLEQDAANAKAEMAKQETRAATAEQALLELQHRLEHRRISKAEHDRFVAALLPYQGSAVSITEFGELEAGRFADDIISVFKDAKWKIGLTLKNMVSPHFYSLVCYVDEKSDAGRHVAAILGQLPTSSVLPGIKDQGVVANIIVGIKPPA